MIADMTKLHVAAKTAFDKQLRDKVAWISGRCWESNLENHVKELNEIIDAGTKLGVAGESRQLTEQEIKNLVSTIQPLKILKMEAETRAEILDILGKAGVDSTIFV